MIDRQEFADELILRESIRKVIKIVLEKRKREEKQQLNEEKQLRSIIRKLIITEAGKVSTKTPHRNTGINVLEDMLNNVLTNIETDYKSLTTSPEQRKSYRAHIVKGIMNILAPSRAMEDEPDKDSPEELNLAEVALRPLDELEEEEEDIDITIDDDADEEGPNLGQEAFIDVDADDPEDEDTFTIAGENETGRNKAQTTFDGGLQKQILDHYELLADDEDRSLFYDYLITNVKLWMDRWEDELAADLEEPTTPEYEEAAEEAEGEEIPLEGGEDLAPAPPEGEEELELEL
tara:strand:+ start:340 stop:1212 length:873 start_codon:yes stop_codon:yes gene_type:complete